MSVLEESLLSLCLHLFHLRSKAPKKADKKGKDLKMTQNNIEIGTKNLPFLEPRTKILHFLYVGSKISKNNFGKSLVREYFYFD